MHRIDGPGATVSNQFTQGNPLTATPATVVTDPGHSHSASFRLGTSAGGLTWAYGGTADNASQGVNVVANTTGISIQNNSSGSAHNIMQPTVFLNAMIKL